MTNKKSKYWIYPETECEAEKISATLGNLWVLGIFCSLGIPFFAICLLIASYEGTKSPDSPYGINVVEPKP